MRRAIAIGNRVRRGRTADDRVRQGRFIQRDRRVLECRLRGGCSRHGRNLRHVDIDRLRGRAAMAIAQRDHKAVGALIELGRRIDDRRTVHRDGAMRRSTGARSGNRVRGGCTADDRVRSAFGQGDRAVFHARACHRRSRERRRDLRDIHIDRLRGRAAGTHGSHSKTI